MAVASKFLTRKPVRYRPPATSQLIDNFITANTSRWFGYGTSVACTSGQLVITVTSAYPGIYSLVGYNMTGSSVYVQAVSVPNVGNGSTSAVLLVQPSTNNQMSIGWADGNLLMRETVAGTNSDTTLTYDTTNHAWWRLREAAGTLYWETSPDSVTWTVRRSKTRAIPAITSVTVGLSAGYYGTETSPGTAVFDNMNIPAVAAAGARPYFTTADWMWNVIPSSPVLDTNSTTWAGYLASGTHSLSMHDYGVALTGPTGITSSTPRYAITFTAGYGDPFTPKTMPIPAGQALPPYPTTTFGDTGDAHLSVADSTQNLVYSVWQIRPDGAGFDASYGGLAYLNGDGREYVGSSTATNLSRYGCVIRAAEIQAGQINHALFFASDVCAGTFRYPAQKSDGANPRGVATPIPQGVRVQMDPTINLSAISGITPGELTIGTALQTYGAYLGDSGGASMGFLCEYQSDSNPGSVYTAAGLTYDYFSMTHLPWTSLRVLSSSTGT